MQCQQDAVYAAERTIDQGAVYNLTDATFFVNAMVEAEWWGRLIPNVLGIDVARGRPGRGVAGVGWYDASALAGRVEFAPTAALTERRLVHEVAHVVAGARKNSKSHDPWMTRIYLELTYLARGSKAYLELHQAFTSHGVDFDAEGLAVRA